VILAHRLGNQIGWLCSAIGFTLSSRNLSGKQVWEVLTATTTGPPADSSLVVSSADPRSGVQ
jgi:hypothetical protein